MIREKTILCKLNQVKISDSALMDRLKPSDSTCPSCGASQCCKPHDSYERWLISIVQGVRDDNRISISRVLCSSCRKTHALLSDVLIPFGSYSLRFILHVLKAYICRTGTVVALCESFCIAVSTLYKWIGLFEKHAKLILKAIELKKWDNQDIINHVENVVALPSWFFQWFQFSFLQNHERRRLITDT